MFTHHLHTVGSIKLALSNSLKTLVVIRNPLDSVGSFLAYHSDDLDSVPTERQVRHFLSNYYPYFRFLNDKKDLLHFISFKNMIADKKSTIGGIAEILGLPEFRLSDDLLEDYDRKMRNAETKKDRNAGSLPNKQKEAFQAKVSKLIIADANFPKCSNLFNSLEARTINAVE
ncbi:MAG: sulfotransferase domain-containing protein [Gammaproteobacteria bacterium]|nr:sulfotransferase domain-containing protein [Gammaproteobacteria bacterium]